MHVRRLLLLSLLFSLVHFLPAQAVKPISQVSELGFSQERLDRLDTFLEKKIASGKIPGAVSLIFREGQVVQYQSFGYQNADKQTPMPKDAIFYIQSMTKPVVSVGLMMLYEEGYFELTDPVARYLPQFANPVVARFDEGGKMDTVPAKNPITIAQCFSHTAGFLHGLGNSKLNRMYMQQLYYQPHQTIQDRVNALAQLPLVDEPGASWHYSASPDILAALIEHFSGMTCEAFLQQRIFDPLGMEDTGYNVPEAKWDRVATVHERREDGKLYLTEQQNPKQQTVFGGTHGLFSTAADYLRFCQMLLNEGRVGDQQLLSPKTIELMTVDHTGNNFRPGAGFGLGFQVRMDLGTAKALGTDGHYFWNGMFNTYFFIDPEEKLISILMMQFLPYTDIYSRKHRHFLYQAMTR